MMADDLLSPLTPHSQGQDFKECGQLVALISTLGNIELTKENLKVGRSNQCQVVLGNNHIAENVFGNISKEHFLIINDIYNKKVYIKDLSKNGTFVNGVRIQKNEKILLLDGANIAIGRSDYNVYQFQSVEKLPPTLTPSNLSDDCLLLTPTEKILPIWGRLIPCMMYLESVDLVKPSIKLGRSPNCDININRTNLSDNIRIIFSKEHFVIHRDMDNLVTYIKDLSKSGTYLNGNLVGRNNMHILQNDDKIGVGNKKFNLFLYKCMYSKDLTYLPPELQKKYEPSILLGTGGSGEVRLAYEKCTCKMFAIKKIFKARSTTSQMYKLNHPSKIHMEVNILQSLSHPFVIKMKEIVETPDEVFIVLDYMKGGELTNRILSMEALSESNVKFLFYQIVLAVQFLHSKGISHRDLKPENVLLATDDVETLIKVTDFGLSKVTEDDDMMRTVCGTYCYIAPEVLNTQIPEYNKQVDVWSLGVILYYMLSKNLPFKSSDKRVLHNLIIGGFYTMNDPCWEAISRQAKDLVKRMLTVKPQNRISVDDILRHPWFIKDRDTISRVNTLLECNMITSEEIIMTYDIEPPRKRIRLSSSDESTI